MIAAIVLFGLAVLLISGAILIQCRINMLNVRATRELIAWMKLQEDINRTLVKALKND